MIEMIPGPDYSFKFILLGDSGTGKSAINSRYNFDKFVETSSTVGVDHAVKDLTTEDGTWVKVTIWDTAGQERFNGITGSYIRGSQGIILVYDITRRITFEHVPKWIDMIRQYEQGRQELPPIVLVGNKTDLEEHHRELSVEEVTAFAEEHNLTYIEASALQGLHIDYVFDTLISQCIERAQKLPKTYIPPPRKQKDSIYLVTGEEAAPLYCPCSL